MAKVIICPIINEKGDLIIIDQFSYCHKCAGVKALSVLSFDYDTVKVKLHNGEVTTIEDISKIKLIPTRFPLWPNLMVEGDWPKLRIRNGFLEFIFICDSTAMITAEIMTKIVDVTFSGNIKYYAKIKFADGSVNNFCWKDNSLISVDGKKYDAFTENHYYCQQGKMTECKILEYIFNISKFIVKVNSGDIYEFYNMHPYAKHIESGLWKIYALNDFALFVFDRTQFYWSGRRLKTNVKSLRDEKTIYAFNDIGIYTVDNLVIVHEAANIVDLHQQDGKLTITDTDGNKNDVVPHMHKTVQYQMKYSDYYSVENCDIFNAENVYYNYNGECYDSSFSKSEKLPYKFPVPSVYIKRTKSIVKIGNFGYRINGHQIFNKILTNIQYIGPNYDFGPYDICVTMHSGAQRRCCMVNDLSANYWLVFEDGEEVKLFEGLYFSLSGPFHKITGYKRINANCYNINGNVVYFKTARDAIEIQESFGDFILIDADMLAHYGEVVVYRQVKATKPALRALP